MASPKMTLRPPPNVDFISGFPGLAPGPPDRPHAAVKGTLEFRTNQPIKAKWLHVELRKIESVPGVPPFTDIVGAKPTIVWQPNPGEGDFGTLQPQDFSFAIRIPESVPPTILLDNGRAGIRYELIATLCAKGKKGLLRRESPALTTTSCEIVILKHEMHATWPVYAQPEERNVSLEGLTLTVSRRRTCLGAGGDSLAIQATVTAEGLVPLAGFELSLVQKIAYPNTGAAPGGRKAATIPPRMITISEQKIPLNARIQPATARLIENTYMIIISAILEGNKTVKITLPITISPFPIPYSADMMQRMGQPPMALDHPSRALYHQQQLAAASRPASTTPSMNTQTAPGTTSGHPPPIQQRPYNITQRIGGQAAAAAPQVDDSLLGGELSSPYGQTAHNATMPPSSNWQGISTNRPGTGGAANATYPANTMGGYGEFGQPTGAQNVSPQEPPPAAPPTVATTTGRFTVVNTDGNDLDSPRSSRIHDAPFMTAADEKRMLAMQANDPQGYAAVPPPGPPPSSPPANAGGSSSSAMASPAGSQPPKKKWLTAEQEKQKLYDKARAAADATQRKAANTQGSISKSSSPKGTQFTEAQLGSGSGSPSTATVVEEIKPAIASPKPSTQKDKKWLTAEDEKRKLYEKAQAKAAKTQAKAAIAASGGSGVARADSARSQNSGTSNGIVNPYNFTSTSSPLKGADLYSSAMSAIKSPTATAASTTPSPSDIPPKSNSPPVATPVQVQQAPPLSAAPPVKTPPPFTPPPITPPAHVHQFASDTPPPASPPAMGGWLSAEDEKARLRYLDAKRAVARHTAAQDDDYGAGSSSLDHGGPSGSGYMDYGASGSASGNYSGVASGSGYMSPPPVTSPRNDVSGYMSPPPGNPPSWNTSSPAPPPVVVDPPQQPASYSPPPVPPQQSTAYQSTIAPPPINLSSTPTPPPPSSEPPPFSPSLGYTHATDIPEKEKMRLAYAAQDQAPPSSSNGDLPPPDYGGPPPGNPPPMNGYGYDSPPPMDGGMYSSQPLTAAEEKARLKAQWAAEDTGGSFGGSSSSGAGGSSSIYNRPPPEPPLYAEGTRTLTAAEEKARLQAQYAAERPISSVAPAPPPRVKSPPLSSVVNTPVSTISERPPPSSYLSSSSMSSDNDYLRRDPSISQGKQRAHIPGNGISQSPLASPAPSTINAASASPPAPPPLAPRPPKSYIDQTKEEDLKIRRMTGDTSHFHSFTLDGDANQNPPWMSNEGNNFSLGLRPFSPIDLSLDDMLRNGNANPQPMNGATKTPLYR